MDNKIRKMKDYSALASWAIWESNRDDGEFLNEADLVEALKEHRLAGAGLDVFENEPFCCNSPLLEIKDATKLIMTPHIAWAPIETRNRVIEEQCLNIEGFKTNNLRNVCNML